MLQVSLLRRSMRYSHTSLIEKLRLKWGLKQQVLIPCYSNCVYFLCIFSCDFIKVNFLIHVTILQIWYFFNHQSSKFGFFHTNICVLVLCTILSKKFSEKSIILAEKPHYATQMFSQPQQMIFFMNNRLTGGWNLYANPFVILLY